MKIVVCIKQVNGEINPFDACALECALQLNNAEITIISMGRDDVAVLLQRLTRLGTNRAILLSDSVFAGADTLATSYTLSLAIDKIKPDLIICGRQSVDGDTAQVGPCLSKLINYNLITNVLSVDNINEKSINCTSRIGNETENFPALITVERINTLRFPSIRSKKHDVEIWSAEDIGANVSRCGLHGSPTTVVKTFESVLGRRKCKFITPDKLSEIINISMKDNKNKVIVAESKNKLDEVWTVGEESARIAKGIAKKLRILPKTDVDTIAKQILEEKPDVVLWDSSAWGRKHAPQVAAMLKTGLCADCTKLETDGKQLFMYRPAYGGNIMAKIRCRTKPVMATVRSIAKTNNEVILSIGLGAVDHIDVLTQYAEKYDFKLGASRSVVDKGLMPYELQVGLTGRNVAPNVYIACGISGAVHHTSAIERTGIIIAINPDKSARIFDYADYGILQNVENVLDVTIKPEKEINR